MVVHAFIDESGSRDGYQLTVAAVPVARLAAGRKQLRALLLPGAQELHCRQEKSARRRQLADTLVASGFRAMVYLAICSGGHEPARQRCLRRAVDDLLVQDVRRIILDTREGRDRLDEQVLRAALGPKPSATGIVYAHRDSRDEPLLWVADVLGWCFNAGGEYRRRVIDAVDVVHVGP